VAVQTRRHPVSVDLPLFEGASFVLIVSIPSYFVVAVVFAVLVRLFHLRCLMSIGVAYDKRCEDHSANYRHVERPERIQCIWAALEEGGYFREGRGFTHLPCREATDGELWRVHSRELIASIDASAAAHYNPSEEDSDEEPVQGSCKPKYPDCRYLDDTRDTFVSKGSSLAARCAAGGLIELCLQVSSGALLNGMAVVRPPGHHAEHNEAMGFCLYNSVAVATRAVQAADPSSRVAIVDWDVHHGNGTQNILCDGSSGGVLYLSVHRYGDGFFPGTGAMTDCGCVGTCTPAVRSTAINVPLRQGAGDGEYLHVIENVFVPAVVEFGATMIIVSAGFDCAVGDPLGGMMVTPLGFGAMLHRLLEALEISRQDAGRGPGKQGVVVALEGGYSPEMLATSSLVCADVLHGSLIPKLGDTQCSEEVAEVVDEVRSFQTQHGWKSFRV
jgi:acetoin utilization deacetylase AcuC-like enzyme